VSILQQSTANQWVLAYLRDEATLAPVPGLTDLSVGLTKHGAESVLASDGACQELGGGYYAVRLDATDTDTPGTLAYVVAADGCDPHVEIATVLGGDPVAPTGLYADYLKWTAAALAASTTFQAWVGAADAAGAMARIGYVAVPGDDVARPCAFVRQAGGWRWSRQDTSLAPQPGNRTYIVFEQDVPAAWRDLHADAEFTFSAPVATIMDEVWEAAIVAGYPLEAFEAAETPVRASQAEGAQERDFVMQPYLLTWGMGGAGHGLR
jgi:hypothetical protein